jgi:hypothetical protein
MTALDRGRLARVLGRLGSSFDADVVTAARMADGLVRSSGLTWPDVIGVARDVTPHSALIAECLGSAALTSWEVQFCTSLRRCRRLSDRQRATLNGIVEKVRAAFTEAA